MSIVLFVGIVFISLLLAGFLWGYVRIKQRQSDVMSLILSVSTDEIPLLTNECMSVFQSKLGKYLSLEDADSAVRILEEALENKNEMNTITAFEQPGHPGWFVKPMGAFLGELLRRHANGCWTNAEDGGLAIVVGEEPNTMTTHPFHKINKQRWSGESGDLNAYLAVAKKGPDGLKDIVTLAPVTDVN